MRVALTGAGGFIGRYVISTLAEFQVETVAVTRSAARLVDLPPAVSVVELDLAAPPADCFAALRRPDVLIHLAWGGLPNYRSDYHETVELPRQRAFLENLVSSGLPSLLVTGTCLEYGLQSGCLAEDAPAAPVCAYGRAKDQLRRELLNLQARRPFNLTWARLFYTFGDGQSAASLYSSLKSAVERGDPLFNMSSGEQVRDFLPVAAVAQSLVKLALLQADIGTINICSGQPLSVRARVEQWLRENRWQIELNPGCYPYPDYEPMAFWGSRTKLDNWLARWSELWPAPRQARS